MHQINEMELWSRRRHELVRKAESLARRPKRAVRMWSALLGWALEAPVRLRAEDAGRA